MPRPLLLDEMFPQAMADQLSAKGHDVRAVVATPVFAGLPDEEILIGAAEAGRALVTANIKDFMPIDARYRATGRTHAGLIMVSRDDVPAEPRLYSRGDNSTQLATRLRPRMSSAGRSSFSSASSQPGELAGGGQDVGDALAG